MLKGEEANYSTTSSGASSTQRWLSSICAMLLLTLIEISREKGGRGDWSEGDPKKGGRGDWSEGDPKGEHRNH